MSIEFVVEYIKTKRAYLLLGIPLVCYFFIVFPIFGMLNINESISMIITAIMVVIAFVYAYIGWKTSKKSKKSLIK